MMRNRASWFEFGKSFEPHTEAHHSEVFTTGSIFYPACCQPACKMAATAAAVLCQKPQHSLKKFDSAITCPTELKAWATRQIELMKQEHDEEVETVQSALAECDLQELEERGTTLTCLKLESASSGLFGRTQLTLTHRHGESSLPPHKFSPGEVVGLVDHKLAKAAGAGAAVIHSVTGVVSRVTEGSIQVSVDDRRRRDQDEDDAATALRGDRVRIDVLPNDVTHKRVTGALHALQGGHLGPAARMVRSMFPWAYAEPSTASASQGSAVVSFPAAHPCASLRASPDDLPRVVPMDGLQLQHDGLNDSQQAAVRSALGAQDIMVVHGPPGTGKTTTIIEIITQAVARGQRVLACAPSNVAVDNMLARLVPRSSTGAVAAPQAKSGTYAGGDAVAPSLVRIGHPARVDEELLQYTLDAATQRADGASVVVQSRRDLDSALRDVRKAKRSRAWESYRDAKALSRALRKEVWAREKSVTREVLQRTDIVLSTISGAASRTLQEAVKPRRGHASADDGDSDAWKHAFDLVVIDEAAQATEASCWIPLLLGRRAVLAGDHLQLPPTVMSQEAEAAGLGYTIMDRMVQMYDQARVGAEVTEHTSTHGFIALPPGGDVIKLLNTQYRMHQRIMQWSSDMLYDSKLLADTSVATHTLLGLASVQGALSLAPPPAAPPASIKVGDVDVDIETLGTPLVFVDSAGCDCREAAGAKRPGRRVIASESKSNEGEAEVVVRYVAMLLAAGVPCADIAVITPYNAQVALLSERLGGDPATARVAVRSVDGYQGQEKEVIVMSLVRSNSDRQVGFLSDYRRLNVAVTRARRHCMIVGDSDTVCADPFIRTLFRYAEKLGEVQTAAGWLGTSTVDAGTTAVAADLMDSIPAAPPSAPLELAEAPKPKKRARNAPAELQLPRSAMDTLLNAHLRTLAGLATKMPSKQVTAWVKSWSTKHPAQDTRELDRCISATASTRASTPAAAASLTGVAALLAAITQQVLGAVAASAPADARAQLAKKVTPDPILCPDLPCGACLGLLYPASATSFVRARAHEAADRVMLHHESLLSSTSAGSKRQPQKRLLVAACAPIEEADDAAADPAVAGAAASAPPPAGAAASSKYVQKGVAAAQRSTSAATAGSSAPNGGDRAEKTLRGVKAPTTANAVLAQLAAERQARAQARRSGATVGSNTAATAASSSSQGNGWGDAGQQRDVASVAAKAAEDAKRKREAALAAGAAPEEAEAYDDDMALLDAMVEQTQKRCGRDGCQGLTTGTGAVCRYCKLKYCYKHALPEQHGCGEAARSAAREGVLRSAASQAAGRSAVIGGGRAIAGSARHQVKRQLDKKLAAASEARQAGTDSGTGGRKGKKSKKKKG